MPSFFPLITSIESLLSLVQSSFYSLPSLHRPVSSSGLHRASGVFGALVVREADDPQRHLYDTDLPEHVLVLSDWNHVDIETFFWASHHRGAFIVPRNVLFNGRGRDPATGVSKGLFTRYLAEYGFGAWYRRGQRVSYEGEAETDK